MPRVSCNVLNTLVAAGQGAGIAMDALLDRVGLSAEQLEDRELRVDCGVAFDLAEALTRASGDPHFGLNSAAQLPPETVGVIGHLALSARTPWEALDAYCRFQRLMGDGLLLTHAEQGPETLLTVSPHPALERDVPPGTVEQLLASLVQMALRLGVETPPAWVSFRHAGCPPWGDYAAAFGGAPVRFSAGFDALAYPTAALHRPTRGTDPALYAYLEARARVLIERINDGGETTRRVAEELVRQLRVQRPSAASVARALAMSVRSLQRALAAEGQTFQGLLDRARCELACHHLATSPGPVAEVGYLLGFLDESAFRKAFRRWTGQSPGEYRAALAAGDPAAANAAG